MTVTSYVVEVEAGGGWVRRDVTGGFPLAASKANEWRRQGFRARVRPVHPNSAREPLRVVGRG